MPLPYTPMTEQEDKERNLIPPGEYSFRVEHVELKRTKNGKYDMIALDLAIELENRERKMMDWCVFMDEMKWKFRHLCATTGLLDKYEAGTVEVDDLFGKMGFVKIGQKLGQDQSGNQVMNNNVLDYIKPENAKPMMAETEKKDDFVSDDLPF